MFQRGLGKYLIVKPGLARWRAALLVAVGPLFVEIPAHAAGPPMTIKDLADGIAERESSIRDIDIEYSIHEQHYDAFYEHLKFSAPPNTDPSRVPVPIGESLERVTDFSYHVMAKGNLRRFQEFKGTGKDRKLLYEGGYDGEVLRVLNAMTKVGGSLRYRPDGVIQFPTVSRFLGLNGLELTHFLGLPTTDSYRMSIESLHMINGNPVASLIIEQVSVPAPREVPQYTITVKNHASVVSSKGFWPSDLSTEYIYSDSKEGKTTVEPISDEKVGKFIESNGISYPGIISRNSYYSKEKWDFSVGYAPVLGTTSLESNTVLTVDRLAINTGLANDAFNYQFPVGTTFLDSIAGIRGVVGEPVDEMIERMKDDRFDPSPPRPSNSEGLTNDSEGLTIVRQATPPSAAVDRRNTTADGSSAPPSASGSAEWWTQPFFVYAEMALGAACLAYGVTAVVRHRRDRGT
jgi:hypothetical protein